ncbi:hypothetical protein PBR71_02775 [Levilactobacillus brevis]|uniref:hypothetical protein n=1 Tax=Levilactobacillus brevis TaxID=1580 RepID=UPI0022DE15B0|nr:hypothetical protein [Levilactobacillus brevis]MDA0409622.1 hypothetical protein [Levilactobacillus brevis]
MAKSANQQLIIFLKRQQRINIGVAKLELASTWVENHYPELNFDEGLHGAVAKGRYLAQSYSCNLVVRAVRMGIKWNRWQQKRYYADLMDFLKAHPQFMIQKAWQATTAIEEDEK